jgi:site-specific recombinase XerD
MAYRHGLRVSELVALRWDQVDLDTGRLQVIRRKGSDDACNQGVDTRTLAAYLGHRQIANTTRYTKMDARRFDGFWHD